MPGLLIMNPKDKIIEEEVVEYKVYKEKPYLNSDRDPLGVSINGKTKEYLQAHETIKGLIKKGKQYSIEKRKIKFLDVTQKNAMVSAIVEVSDVGGVKGNVEFKIYNPSTNKKKGATLELRKMSGHEYNHVQILKDIIILLLDGFILGEDVEQVFKTDAIKRAASKVTSKPKLFSCDQCDWETRLRGLLQVI